MKAEETGEDRIVEKALTLAGPAFDGIKTGSQVQIVKKEVSMKNIGLQRVLFIFHRMTSRVREVIINALTQLVNDQRYAAVPVMRNDLALRVRLRARRY